MPASKFSKAIAVTYIALGSFALLFSVAVYIAIWKAITSRQPPLLLSSGLALAMACGSAYIVWSLHRRRKWARYVALSFWALRLIWSLIAIVRNGPHPEPAKGPLKYSNEHQLAGARFAALWTPYILAIVESSAIYYLLRKRSIVHQFQ